MDLSNKCALVIDDMMSSRTLTQTILKALGMKHIYLAPSGEDGLALLIAELEAGGHVDVILLDWHMPGLTGIELVKFLKGNEMSRNIPIIMITSEVKMNRVVDALKSGVANYITKPLTQAVLETKLKQLFKEAA